MLPLVLITQRDDQKKPNPEGLHVYRTNHVEINTTPEESNYFPGFHFWDGVFRKPAQSQLEWVVLHGITNHPDESVCSFSVVKLQRRS